MNDAEIGFFLTKLVKKIAKPLEVAVSPVLAADKLLRKVPLYKQASQLAPFSKEREKALQAMHGLMGHAHNLVTRAKQGDASAKQAISSTIDAAAKGDPRARAAVHALTAARLQQKTECQLAGGRAASAGELAIVRGLPHLDRVELVTAGCAGRWLPTAGGDVFVPGAYEGTAGARAARGQRLVMTPRITRQLRAAAEQERRGKLPLGTTRRWAERAVSGFQSDHGTAQTLREWLGQDPALNIALK
jgi:hypothetical protein